MSRFFFLSSQFEGMNDDVKISALYCTYCNPFSAFFFIGVFVELFWDVDFIFIFQIAHVLFSFSFQFCCLLLICFVPWNVAFFKLLVPFHLLMASSRINFDSGWHWRAINKFTLTPHGCGLCRRGLVVFVHLCHICSFTSHVYYFKTNKSTLFTVLWSSWVLCLPIASFYMLENMGLRMCSQLPIYLLFLPLFSMFPPVAKYIFLFM